MVYRPEDVYISELFGSLAQLDAGVTSVMDVSQIHHSPEHSDARVKALVDAGRRSVFGYFEGWGERTKYPGDARRLKLEYFSSDDQLLTMAMGGEIYIPGYENAWGSRRELGHPDRAPRRGHIRHGADLRPAGARRPVRAGQHLHPHDRHVRFRLEGGRRRRRACLAVRADRDDDAPRHAADPEGARPRLQPSLSSDVECTMTADFFTQMRSALTLQRAFVNEARSGGGTDLPELLTSRDVHTLRDAGRRQGPEARPQGRHA